MERVSFFELPESFRRVSVEKTVFVFSSERSFGPLQLDWAKSLTETIDIYVGENVNLDVVEFTSTLSRKLAVYLDKGSRVDWKSVHLKNEKTSQIAFQLNEGSCLEATIADFSEGTETLSVEIDMIGNQSTAEWNMAALSYNRDQKSIEVSVHHRAPATTAHVSNYGVVQGNGFLKFSGTSHILHGSHRSKTRQNAKIMVFDPHSVGRAEPILKIDENDVEASHAAAVGKVNDEHLFYLTSRGLKPSEAKRLITMGYLNPIIRRFDSESIKKRIEKSIKGRI